MPKDQPQSIPRVSIGMPVYNGEKFIRKALDSLLAQTFTDFELIISDNASIDSTGDLCKDYAHIDPRITFLRHPDNLGPAENFKTVFKKARAQYFMWAACDDMWDSLWLEKCVEVLDTHSDVVLVFSNFQVFSHSNGFRKSVFVVPSLGSSAQRLSTRFINCCANLIYGVFRKDCLEFALIKQIDFWDVFFSNYMAVKGNIYVLNDFLFYAGIKNENKKPYSIMGPNIKILPYFKLNVRLINYNFNIFHKIGLYMILFRQVFGFYKAYNNI